VLRIDGYRFFFFSNEGWEPRHVHVERGAGTAKHWLEPVGVAYSSGMTVPELRRATRLIELHRDYILERWYEYFGT